MQLLCIPLFTQRLPLDSHPLDAGSIALCYGDRLIRRNVSRNSNGAFTVTQRIENNNAKCWCALRVQKKIIEFFFFNSIALILNGETNIISRVIIIALFIPRNSLSFQKIVLLNIHLLSFARSYRCSRYTAI